MQEADYTKGLQIDQRVGDELMLPREHTHFQKEDSFSVSPCCLRFNDEEAYHGKMI